MKTVKLIPGLVLVAFIAGAVACGGKGGSAEKSSKEKTPALVEVSIGGMTCTGCEQTVTNKLTKLEGVAFVKASFTEGKAVVEYFPDLVDTVKMKEAITSSGYTVKKFNASPAQ